MSENEKNYDTDPVIFEDEEGNEYAFQPIDFFFYNGEEYALLTEVTGEEDEEDEGTEVIVCRVKDEAGENDEELETYELIDDEELAAKLVEIANTKLEEDDQIEE